jgi:DNA primase
MTGSPQNGRITDALLATIRDRVTVSSVVSKHVKLAKHGHELVGLCPFHQEKTPSFTVNDSKQMFKCFGCGVGGDVLDFVQQIYRLDFREAVTALATENGLDAAQATIDPKILERNEKRRKEEADREKRIFEYAVELWHHSSPAQNSPVEKYLRNRLIRIPVPDSIRYHHEVEYRLDDGKKLFLPTMIAQDIDADGRMTAAHLTFIMRDGSGKANVPQQKKIYGSPSGSGVYLGRVADQMQIVEGIETGLSLQERTGIPTIAALSTAFLALLKVPDLPYCRRLTIGADNDENGAGEKAAIVAATRFRSEGREVKIIKPRGFKDYNDLVRGMRSSGPSI